MAGGDGWWAAPLALPSPTRSLPPRALIGGGGFGVHGVAGEGGPSGAFASSSASGSFPSSARSCFSFGPGGVISAGRARVEMRCGGNGCAIDGGGAGEIMDAEVSFGGGEAPLAASWKPPPRLPQLQQQQKVPSPVKNGKSIAERRAERCGFSAPRINTAKFRCSGSPVCSPAAVRSPCLTIPPGLSPTALLDSPVMMTNAQAQPSPTTGTFPSSLHNHETLATLPLKVDMEKGNSDALDSSFFFKLPQDPVSMACIQSAKSKVSLDPSTEYFGTNYIHLQTLAKIQMQTEYERHAGFSGEILSKSYASDSQSDVEASDDTVAKGNNAAMPSCHAGGVSDETQLEEHPNGSEVSQRLQDGDQAGAFPSLCAGRPSDDGFNWRKYGQKQVKGSEYPRSYYKCTHPNCQVKKKVERSYDGQITEIIYKGKHNHPKPQPARRTIIGSSFPLNEMSETPENPGSSVKTEGKSVWSNPHSSEEDSTVCQPDALERMSSTSAVTDLSDPLSTALEKHLSELESTGNLDLSSTLASHDEDDQATQESMSVEGGDEDDKSDSKIRKSESYLIETSSASRAVREPRVVVQTESEVDILDDGYRWRKYGQKVVKGNPNPRSYYKCTNPGCSVRKHVERAAHDLKSVITTYEGKHNHEVPVARNTSHSSSSGGSFPPASNAESSMMLAGSTVNPEHTTSDKDLAPHFKRKLDLSNDYVKPSYPGSLCGDTKFRAPSCYETKLLQQLAFQPSGLSINQAELLQASSVANLSPEFPIPFSMGIRRASNGGLAGIDGNLGGTGGAAAQSLLGQQHKLMDLRFLRAPKQEQKDEGFYSSVLPMNNLAGASPSLCGQLMGGYPLQ